LRCNLLELGANLHAEVIPQIYKDLAALLMEDFSLPGVDTTALADISYKFVYS
jgi:hypothetical protein